MNQTILLLRKRSERINRARPSTLQELFPAGRILAFATMKQQSAKNSGELTLALETDKSLRDIVQRMLSILAYQSRCIRTDRWFLRLSLTLFVRQSSFFVRFTIFSGGIKCEG